MADVLMLIAVSVGSMAFSILSAYGILRAGFNLMTPRPQPAAAKRQPEAARAL
jgi:hypothetical protein